MLNTVAVGTDGSSTAAKAVDFAIDLAEKYDSCLVVISSYRKLTGDQHVLLAAAGTYAVPHDLQWSPTQEVEAILAEAEAKAQAQGVATTTVAGA